MATKRIFTYGIQDKIRANGLGDGPVSATEVFRIVFELFLVVSSAFLGASLSTSTKTYWVWFIVTFIPSIIFLALSIWTIPSTVPIMHINSETRTNGQSFLSKLKDISIEGPEDFAANIDLYLSGEKSID